MVKNVFPFVDYGYYGGEGAHNIGDNIISNKILTKFLGELALRGSSAANIADENIIQANIMLLKWLWLLNQWQNTRNLYIENKLI